MEDCRNEECVCRKYEPEFDKKFSSRGMSTRKLTRRQSSMTFSFGGPSRHESQYFRKKAPVKISYDSKCAIFKAELADCLDRFSQSPKCRSTGAGVGIKLQKSYFYHEHMASSYKALFVQLENSLQCKTFLGRVHIYHLKTLIQEEMIHSESSPLASLDITSCLKFEERRLLFEQRITDLCLACEQFWAELISRGEAPAEQKPPEEEKKEDEDEEEDEEDDALVEGLDDVVDDYNVEKVSSTLLEIASTIIDIKGLYAELCQLNGQSVAVLQSYALVYRYILRDEYRFEELVSSLNQLHRTNKLEHTRDNTPAFFDSDDYVLLQVSGDLKDLGRVLRVSRGIEQVLGFTPDEIKGSKIEKIMPALYAQVHEDFMHVFLRRGYSHFIDANQFLLAQNKLGFLTVILLFVKALVDLRQGLMFVAFIKAPVKVPLTYDTKDGQCTAQTGAVFEKTKDAHFLLCDGKGFIHNMSQNCMKNLGLPPTLVFKQNPGASNAAQSTMIKQTSAGNVEMDEGGFGGNSLVNINKFAANILGPEYEFDLVRGMNFVFDTSSLKTDKGLAKEFAEIKNRMCRYNISVSMRRTEYRLKAKDFKLSHEILLFTIVINSYSFTDTPNIVIPVFRDEDEQFASVPAPAAGQLQDEMRTSKFKEFKARVQELQMPSKVAKLQRITFGFFFFLIGVFSLNYGICVSSNQNFSDSVEVREIVFQFMDRVPSTARFVRTALNIANGFEYPKDDVLSSPQEDRFTYYMRRLAENSDNFASLQELIYTKYQSDLQFDQSGPVLRLSDLQTDFSLKTINQTLSGALNLFLSKALKVNQYTLQQLRNVTVPYLDFRQWNSTKAASQVQIDLYFILKNGNEVIPKALQELSEWTEKQVEQQSNTFSLVSIIIAVSSVLAITIIVVPLVYPLLTHFELLAEIILHAFNKLTPSFVEHEVECCNQLFGHINQKSSEERMIREEAAKNDSTVETSPHPETVSRIKKRSVQRSDRQQYAHDEGGGNMLQLLRKNIEAGMGTGEVNFKKPRLLLRGLVPQNKIFAPSEIIHLGDDDSDNTVVFRKYERRGHMPAVLRRPSYYERMKETFERLQEEDSFREDGTESNNSSQSNYTHQDYHTQQIQTIKHLGLLNPDSEEAAPMQLDISMAKTSDIPKGEAARSAEEDKDLRRVVRFRQNRIKQAMKKSRCQKLISISLLVIAISVYLAVNTIYTFTVFNYEKDLRGNMQVIDRRVLCYPFSLDILKEMLARQTLVPSILSGFGKDNANGTRAQMTRCYQQEQDFSDLILGTNQLSSQLGSVTSDYMTIQDSLAAGNLCKTLKEELKSSPDYISLFCDKVQNGIVEMGLHEALSFMLSQEEKIALDFVNPQRQAISLMLNSSLNEQETLADVFLVPALDYQRQALINVIQSFANYLFGVFDILFGIFVAALCLATSYIGFFYIRKNLQTKIVQIYHVVMLIPHGDSTKRELNNLIKLEM